MANYKRLLGTALTGFGIGYIIGALSAAASTPVQNVTHEVDDGHIRRITRRELKEIRDDDAETVHIGRPGYPIDIDDIEGTRRHPPGDRNPRKEGEN